MRILKTGAGPSPRPRTTHCWPAILLALAMLPALVVGALPAHTQAQAPVYQDPQAPIPERVADLMSRMTLDEKIGQMVQAERGSAGPAEAAAYGLGSILSGGGSAPSPNTTAAWADMYDAYQDAALGTRLAIPIIYGVDAVHGHNNLYGATIFPHNIGLGAANNPALAQQIGQATAEEVAATGIDWTFSPCLCVARNERWGRTYESFGEDPDLVSSMAAIVDGYQGADLSAPASILATAKHYVGDGGTSGGDDQGNTQLSEAELRRIHLAPFREAIRRGVGSIMISYSSWNGVKLHQHRYLISDVLKGELGFSGLVISDWYAIEQLPGSYADQVRAAVNAGIDMFMEPATYSEFISTLRAEVQAGRVSTSRIDDAVSRILTKKFELGLFEQPYADRSYAATVGSAEHRALARDAVRQSLVLLKNADNLLPLAKNLSRVFVAGKNADDIGNQSGGWTISWQGGSGNITPGTSILQGIRNTLGSGTSVSYDRYASGIDSSYDVAIAVVGETPYAEGNGDRTDLGLGTEDLQTLSRIQATGVPLVVILVSGRPMIVTEQLPAWDAFIAAWLPGSEGQGVADVLFGDYAPSGKLPMSWPRSMSQIPINAGDSSYDPLFSLGYGLTYDGTNPPPPEEEQPLERSGWVASASASYSGEPPANALDGSLSTRWSTGTAMSNGQWFQVDMAAAQTFSKLVLDAGGSSGDYPRGYEVYVSDDGSSWGSPIASGTGSQQVTSISFATQNARYIRIVQTGSASNWWSIHELNVYGSGASSGIDSNAYYRVVSRHSGKVLDLAGWSTSNGGNLQQWDYHGGDNQLWRFNDIGGGYYRIEAKHSGKAVEVDSSSTANGANIQQWDYSGGANQQWQVVDLGDGYYQILARHSGKALDVSNISTENGANIHQWEYVGGANQQWQLILVETIQ